MLPYGFVEGSERGVRLLPEVKVASSEVVESRVDVNTTRCALRRGLFGAPADASITVVVMDVSAVAAKGISTRSSTES
jgi:hypothetical protein